MTFEEILLLCRHSRMFTKSAIRQRALLLSQLWLAAAICGASIISTAHAASSYVLVPLTNVWKYNATGTNLGTAWVQTNYDDSEFLSGPGGLGVEDNPAITNLLNTTLTLSNAANVYITNFYFRTHFTLTNNPSSVTLTSSNQIDDGAVFYVNGQEFNRIRMPTGTIQATTLASANANPEGVFTNAVIPSSMLVQGDNVLAVEVHQGTTTSSDIVFLMAVIVDSFTNTAPLITAQPVDTGSFPNQSPSLSVTASGTAPLRYQWFSNNVALANATNATLPFPSVQTNSSANYFVVVTNVSGSVTSRIASLVVVTTSLTPLKLMEFTNVWRYNLSGTELGSTWRTNGYDDSAWPAAAGVLVKTPNNAFPEPINPVLALTNSSGMVITTYYFRTHFALPSGYDHIALLSSNLIDDGAVFYLNGLEAGRVRVAAAHTANTFATPSPNDGEGYDTVFIPTTNLMSGDNVMAVEVHQSTAVSSDVVWGMQLRAYVGNNSPASIVNQLASQTVAEGQSFSWHADVAGGQPLFYQWFRNGVALTIQTNATIAFTPAHPGNSGDYFFIASNSLNAVTSSVATLTVIADTTTPKLLAVFATNDFSTVLVIFSEAITAASATNFANYSFAPGITLLNAQLLAHDRVLLTVSGIDPQLDYYLTAANIADTADTPNFIAPGTSLHVGHDTSVPSPILRSIGNVFVIIFENQNWSQIKTNPNCPYINGLLPQASYCENYFGHNNEHPSEPNYIWLEAGSDFGYMDDAGQTTDRVASTNHLSTQLFNVGIEWRGYMESMPRGSTGTTNANPYYGRHNPFAFFDDVTTNYSYCTNHVRPYADFAGDLAAGFIGRYNFITPNITNDMHDLAPGSTSAAKQGDTWLSNELPQILNSPAFQSNGAVFITWDENNFSPTEPIGMIVLSPLAKGNGYISRVFHDHSSTLRTMQEIFGVRPYLGDVANANTLADLFKDLALTPPVLSNGVVTVTLNGAAVGRTNYVQVSSNLMNWTTISTNVATDVTITINDSVVGQSARFYRVIELP